MVNKKQHMVIYGKTNKEKLEHYFEKDLSEQKEDIIFNVNKFKQFLK